MATDIPAGSFPSPGPSLSPFAMDAYRKEQRGRDGWGERERGKLLERVEERRGKGVAARGESVFDVSPVSWRLSRGMHAFPAWNQALVDRNGYRGITKIGWWDGGMRGCRVTEKLRQIVSSVVALLVWPGVGSL